MAKKGEMVKARVLLEGVYGNVNDVVEVDAGIAADASDLDANPDAVAYAESLKAAPAQPAGE